MLKIRTNTDTMYFTSDDEFYNFCVVPKLVVCTDTDDEGNVLRYTDFNFSDAYNNAIAQNKKFIIRDENSRIFKHGCVSYRTITKPVSNLEEYTNWFYGNKK